MKKKKNKYVRTRYVHATLPGALLLRLRFFERNTGHWVVMVACQSNIAYI